MPNGVCEADGVLRCDRPTRPRKQEVGSALHMRSVVAISHDTELRLMLSLSRMLSLSSSPLVDVTGWP